GQRPAHSFLLHVSSRRIAFAQPDNALRTLALLIRELWGCPTDRDEEGNDIATEALFLRARDGGYHRFAVNLDFFAAQGQGRWWHAPRRPSAFAFAANGTGHMAKYRQWYELAANQDRWALDMAMRTIAGAKETP